MKGTVNGRSNECGGGFDLERTYFWCGTRREPLDYRFNRTSCKG